MASLLLPSGAGSEDLMSLVRGWIAAPEPAPSDHEAAPQRLRARWAVTEVQGIEFQERLRLNLFEDLELVANRRKVEKRGEQDYSWFGTLEGPDGGSVIVVVRDNAIAASAKIGSRIWRVRTIEDGLQLIEEFEERNFFACGGAIPAPESATLEQPDEGLRPEAPSLPGSNSTFPQKVDDGSNIDVLIVYTPDARSRAGNIATIAQLAIDQTNEAYENSNITQRVTLVHTEQISYVESGSGGTDLSRLRAPGDGHMDSVHALRNQYCADIVHLYVGRAAGICGIAYVMSPVSGNFHTSAFGVEVVGCEPGTYTTAHEMGHNMGSTHDRQNGNGGAFPYSFGYQDPGGAFRTVMAYQNGCNGSCPTIPHFSNPDIDWGGRPTGVAVTEPNSAHNTQSINNTAFTVANFRDSQPCFVPSCQEDSYEPDDSCFTQAALMNESSRDYSHCENTQDWVLVGLAGGVEYTIRTTNLGAQSDTELMLLEGEGGNKCIIPVTDDNSGGVGESDEMVYTPTTGACYAIRVRQADQGFGVGREYTLAIDGQMDAVYCCSNLQAPGRVLVSRDGTVSWGGDASSNFNVYRGSVIGDSFSYSHSCLDSQIPGPSTQDAALPSDEGARILYYLVSGTADCGETSLGSNSWGTDRPNTAPCQ